MPRKTKTQTKTSAKKARTSVFASGPGSWWKDKSPKQRTAIAMKAHATRRRNKARAEREANGGGDERAVAPTTTESDALAYVEVLEGFALGTMHSGSNRKVVVTAMSTLLRNFIKR